MNNLSRVEKKGVVLGSISAVIGSLLFGIVNAIWLAIQQSDPFNLLLFFLYFLIGLFISLFPSAMIGIFLARQIERDHNRRSLSMWKSILRGILIVTIFIIVSSGVIGLLIPKMTLKVLIDYAISAWVIAIFICGIASSYLSGQIVDN